MLNLQKEVGARRDPPTTSFIATAPIQKFTPCLSQTVCRCSRGLIQPIQGGGGTVGSGFDDSKKDPRPRFSSRVRLDRTPRSAPSPDRRASHSVGRLVGIKTKRAVRRVNAWYLAERVGFEPTVRLPVRLISSQVHSTTLPPLRVAKIISLRGMRKITSFPDAVREIELVKIRYPEYPPIQMP